MASALRAPLARQQRNGVRAVKTRAETPSPQQDAGSGSGAGNNGGSGNTGPGGSGDSGDNDDEEYLNYDQVCLRPQVMV